MQNFEKLYGLVYGCPLNVRVGNCPFIKGDQNRFLDKVNWVNGLSENESSEILSYHSNCFATRVTILRTQKSIEDS